MKQNTIHAFLMAALLPLAIISCTREELSNAPSDGDVLPLSITVADGGYAAADGQTKALENGYRTEFTAGDECGLYIARGGAVVYDNVKLTATSDAGGSLTWQPEAGTELGGGLDDETYYLYYPYQADMTGKIDVSATDAEGFFAPLVSGWQPAADLSTYAAYTASDLMTANGTATKGTDGTLKLSFSVPHRMALAVIEMPKIVYKFTDAAIPDYTGGASSADFSTSAVKPYCIASGTYRCIVNPTNSTTTSITGSYDEGKKEFTVTPNGIAAGSCKTYRIDGGRTVEKRHNLQVGDFLMKDGSLLPKGTSLNDAQKANVSAIVFHAGQHQNDNSDYSQSGIGQKNCHGYAVALKDATSYVILWGPDTLLGCFLTDASGKMLDNVSNPDIDWNGYAWTRKIITKCAGDVNTLRSYSATYRSVDYQNKISAPAGSSGWFLPAIGQMWSVYRQRSILTTATGGNDLTYGWYWSSSEWNEQPADRAVCVLVHEGIVSYSRKYETIGYARPVLAF